MKSLIAITTVLLLSGSALMAGEDCCAKANAAKAAKTCETACAKAKGSECSKAKSECPKAAAALRQTLLTHKGSMLVRR